MVSSEDPTRVHPSAPAAPPPPAAGERLTPHEPLPGGPGGPADPPLPPTGPPGGGGGNGWDGGPDDPDGDGRRHPVLLVIAGALVVIALLFAISLLSGDNAGDDGRTATETTPAETESSPPPATPPATQAPTEEADEDPATEPAPKPTSGGSSTGGETIDGTVTEPPADPGPLLTAGSVTKLLFKQGESVNFQVTSDTAEEVHVHGYDKLYELAAGETISVSFPAELTGIFEIELEGSGTQIGELTVEP